MIFNELKEKKKQLPSLCFCEEKNSKMHENVVVSLFARVLQT